MANMSCWLGSVEQQGYTYLAWVLAEARREVSEALKLWPTVEQLLCSSSSSFSAQWSTSEICCQVISGRCHFYVPEKGTSVRYAADMLMATAMAHEKLWKVGSFGGMIVASGWRSSALPLPLGMRVGGLTCSCSEYCGLFTCSRFSAISGGLDGFARSSNGRLAICNDVDKKTIKESEKNEEKEKKKTECCEADSGLGRFTERNRLWRKEKKELKARRREAGICRGKQSGFEWRRDACDNVSKLSYKGAFGDCDENVKRKLADTRAQRFIAENEAARVKAEGVVENWEVTQKLRKGRNDLKALQVSQTIELVRSQDVDKLKKRQEVQVMRDTEVSKVQVERAFGTLANSGNVPSAVGGNVQTIVSGTISPNSSVSEQEVRAMQKKCLDQEKQIVELVARLREAKVDEIRNGTYSVGITVDSDGEPIADLGDAYCGYIGKDGRFHQGENYDLW